MPNDTIDRGIKKAAGDINSVNYEYVSYEGYGPGGTAIILSKKEPSNEEWQEHGTQTIDEQSDAYND